ncbi:sigma-70 family RNA polymerase sigma factor [Haloechinothrix sp. LS1_15]|uniref:RNA polymerase sigma factor n=1 Tax=Haloechinothrix sp. LS1_15 TaxID=2652248 RepID=UPI0029465EE4|nr:sigma-70 family RNA polymerase sigma factor [Haloechinothrix sp. LS1_15]MDV6012601.1 sigma-70 family RNA polymerase sigma factor [Haloechinothrix sp. LS1_15]
MRDDEEDAVLVRRVASGDEAALRVLMSRYTTDIHAVAARYRLGTADAMDMVQDVWLRFWQHAATIRQPDRARGWLHRTAHRQAWQLVRQLRREQSLDGWAERAAGDGYGSPEGHVVRAEHARAVWEAAVRLDRRDRELIMAIADEPRISYAQLARRIGVPESSVGSMRTRCLRKLRRQLAKEGILDAGM